MYSAEKSGLVFNIQGYSVHDGPGIRTLVFLKGCPLRCLWCSNPESLSSKPEVGHNASKCLGCGRCVAACPDKALELTDCGVIIDRGRCTGCGRCAKACPAKAMILFGEVMTARAVLDKVEQDAAFYSRSSGGMTVSGGEPFLQFEFLLALLKEADRRAIHKAVETCGCVQEGLFLEGAALLDYLLFDIKHMDGSIHKKVTGRDNKQILRNLQSVRQRYPSLPVHIRTPIIPGVNDSEEAVEAIARFVKDLGVERYELLPFHRLGEPKYGFLGQSYPVAGQKLPEGKIAMLNNVVYRYFSESI
jgi:pyruvate formate lyase activating enzyme